MKTVGEILKEARIKKGITLADVAIATKIRLNLLELIEENKFHKIAEGTVVKGLVKNYAEYLDLSSRDMMAIFRRDFLEDKKGQILLRGTYEPLGKGGFAWTPRLSVFFGGLILMLILAFYFLIQIVALLGAPSLKIESPADKSTTSETSIEVKGKTGTDNVIYINGEIVSTAADGSFKEMVVLSQGDNKIKIEAVSRRGKKTTKEITVNSGS